MELFGIFSKILHLFFQILYMLIEVNNAVLLVKTACLAKFWFSRYGAKRGQNGVKMKFFGIFSKILHLFFQIFYMLIGVNSGHLLAKTACPAKIWLSRYRVKGVKRGSKWSFSTISQKVFICFLDFLHVNRGQQCASFSENCMPGKNLVLGIWGQTG